MTRWRLFALFVLVAEGLAWVACLPIWLGDRQLASPVTQVCGIAMMATPSIAVIVLSRVTLARRRAGSPDGRTARAWARASGLTLGPRPRRTLALTALAWLGVPLLTVISGALSAAVGVLRLDLTGFSGLRALLPATAIAQAGELPGGLRTLFVLAVASALTSGALVTAVAALGEEWGWRGWLQPHLIARIGRWPGLVVTGVVWGLWHAPLTLLGYDYPQLGAWAWPYFVPFTVLAALLLGHLRLASGSIWPAVVGHAMINTTAGLVLVAASAAHPADTAVAGLTGVVGWIVLAAAVAAVVRWVPIPPEAVGGEAGPPPTADEVSSPSSAG